LGALQSLINYRKTIDMHTPTLGYEDDTRISKSEIAQTQLKEAIALFLEHKFLCAITLAGAAEEVLARLLNARGEQSVVEESVGTIQELREKTGLPLMGNRPKKEIFNHWNNARNTIKHHGDKDQETVTVNLFDEAYWMIKRALVNASRLGVPISNGMDFENWCILELHL
jgi:hypothetical protein